MSTIAITRAPSATLAQCQLSFVDPQAIDLALATAQHQDYCRALGELGCELLELPALDAQPDAVFVEDVALVLDHLAIMTRPGAPSRRPESPTIEAALRTFRPIVSIQAPGTLDGGDVLRIGNQIYVGLSARSNPEAIEQLRQLVAAEGYVVTAVAIRDCLHLKSAVTAVRDDTVLINPACVDREAFAAYRQIEVDPQEAHAANTLRIGDRLIYPAGFPRTAQRLQDAGINLRLVDVSELQKAEGAVTCCSLIFSRS